LEVRLKIQSFLEVSELTRFCAAGVFVMVTLAKTGAVILKRLHGCQDRRQPADNRQLCGLPPVTPYNGV
jgi:hypothetical protein